MVSANASNASISSSGSVQKIASFLEQQIVKHPFIPKPKPIIQSTAERLTSLEQQKKNITVRRSTSFPTLPSQIEQTSQIQAAATVQTLSQTPPDVNVVTSPASTKSSPFSISGII